MTPTPAESVLICCIFRRWAEAEENPQNSKTFNLLLSEAASACGVSYDRAVDVAERAAMFVDGNVHVTPIFELPPSRDATEGERQLARAICSVAQSGGMPDSFWETDSRIAIARSVLGKEEVDGWKSGMVYGGEEI